MLFFALRAEALKFLRGRSLLNVKDGDEAVWGDDAIAAALESAAFWVKGLTNVLSLSGYWKFHLAPKPREVPLGFQLVDFDDGSWSSLPGTVVLFNIYCLCASF